MYNRKTNTFKKWKFSKNITKDRVNKCKKLLISTIKIRNAQVIICKKYKISLERILYFFIKHKESCFQSEHVFIAPDDERQGSFKRPCVALIFMVLKLFCLYLYMKPAFKHFFVKSIVLTKIACFVEEEIRLLLLSYLNTV